MPAIHWAWENGNCYKPLMHNPLTCGEVTQVTSNTFTCTLSNFQLNYHSNTATGLALCLQLATEYVFHFQLGPPSFPKPMWLEFLQKQKKNTKNNIYLFPLALSFFSLSLFCHH